MAVPERQRTADVLSGGGMRSFTELLLPQHLLLALREAGFERPSPVQEAAVPLARSGADLVVQAKSGTGKTIVFGIAAVELLRLDLPSPQVLVVAPTREIALQVGEVMSAVSARLPAPGLAIGTFIGGLPTEEDVRRLRRPCHVAVGTPGRLCALVENRALPVRDVRLLVLDEADNLWAADAFRKDVLRLAGALPKQKQVLAMSATFSASALAGVEQLMRRPQRVLLAPDHVSLLGVRQYYSVVPEAGSGQVQLEAKARAFLALAGALSFTQAVLFCARQHEAAWLAQRLCNAGFPAAFLAGARSQVERMDALDAVREFRLRVIVATDLIARGVDLERVNLVANLDLPPSGESYAHRVGRTGRFGTRGVAVTFVTAAELPALHRLLVGVPGAQVEELPAEVPKEAYYYALPNEDERAALAALLPADAIGSSSRRRRWAMIPPGIHSVWRALHPGPRRSLRALAPPTCGVRARQQS
ncbi:hypothetical protein WJX81_000707 [Elliptochloris bilobata]|uniref:DEAD/DEAH box helicase n=1 Tax=Elliptochloris bilobata TaxID=381761 RepID=A0AAW1R3T4_9CHLO